MGEIELPDTFDRQAYLSKHFEQLETWCEILEHLYAEANPDKYVVREIERLVASKLLLVQATDLDLEELNRDSVNALISVLRLSQNEEFGNEWGGPAGLRATAAYVIAMQAEIYARQDSLKSQVSY